jgi:short-subunit dehydrogenase
MPDSELSGRVVVISDASSGFGKGCALRFAENGASVVLAARRDQVLDEVVSACELLGGRALAVPTDMRQDADVAQLAQSAFSEYGRIDVWVNNAGSGAIGRFEDIPLADHISVIETDLIGVIQGSYFALRQFRRQGAGVLINVASIVGTVPAPYFSSYVAAKFGVVGLSAALRQELREEKVDTIHVCTVLPSTFDTTFFEHAARHIGQESSPTPQPILPDTKEVVDAIVRLAAHPEDQVSVGSAAKVSNIVHHLFPGLVESILARQTHKAAFETAGEEANG